MKKKSILYPILLLLLILPLISIAYLVIQIPAIEQKTYNNLESILKLKTNQIAAWLNEREGDGKLLKDSVILWTSYAVCASSNLNIPVETMCLARSVVGTLLPLKNTSTLFSFSEISTLFLFKKKETFPSLMKTFFCNWLSF